jgi:hypothetical protein
MHKNIEPFQLVYRISDFPAFLFCPLIIADAVSGARLRVLEIASFLFVEACDIPR